MYIFGVLNYMMSYENVFKGKRIETEETMNGRSVTIWELILYSFIVIIIFIIICVLVIWAYIKIREMCTSCRRQRPLESSVKTAHDTRRLPRVKVLPVVHSEDMARHVLRQPEQRVAPSTGRVTMKECCEAVICQTVP